MREFVKTGAALAAVNLVPQARYHRMILVLSHMRSASTALCNVLTSHPAISGYGETHVAHSQRNAPGRVLVNLARRNAFRPRSRFLLDKVLHERLDPAVHSDFQKARAVFLLRRPEAAIWSIWKLSVADADLSGTATLETAALYYAKRVEDLKRHWNAFPNDKRIGLCTEDLFQEPEASVAALGKHLKLSPPLENRYVSNGASARKGAGDPTFSGSTCKIEKRDIVKLSEELSGISRELMSRCDDAHHELRSMFKGRRG